jgi:hypothetical protein
MYRILVVPVLVGLVPVVVDINALAIVHIVAVVFLGDDVVVDVVLTFFDVVLDAVDIALDVFVAVVLLVVAHLSDEFVVEYFAVKKFDWESYSLD